MIHPPSQAAAVVLTSGGADSTTLVYWLRHHGVHVVPLFIDYGQHCASTEFATAITVLPEDTLAYLATVSVAEIYAGSSSRLIEEADLWRDKVNVEDMYLPYRNLLLMSTAAAFAQARGFRRVYAGFINSNHAHEIDCSSEFFDRLEHLLTSYGSVAMAMPFRDLTKRDVIELGLELGVPVGRTYSCQISSTTPCGACPNCVERLEAIAGIRHDTRASS